MSSELTVFNHVNLLREFHGTDSSDFDENYNEIWENKGTCLDWKMVIWRKIKNFFIKKLALLVFSYENFNYVSTEILVTTTLTEEKKRLFPNRKFFSDFFQQKESYNFFCKFLQGKRQIHKSKQFYKFTNLKSFI